MHAEERHGIETQNKKTKEAANKSKMHGGIDKKGNKHNQC